jgi:signal transduction histidine kinase
MSPRKNAKAAFASAVLVLFLSAVAAYMTMGRLQASERWVVHTYKVQAALGEVDAAVSKAGRARSSYIASANRVFVDDLDASLPEIQQKLLAVRNLTIDNPTQQQLSSRLEQVTNSRIDLFKQAVDLKNSSPNDAAGQRDIAARDLALAFEKASIMDQMRDEEDRLLKTRTSTSNRFFSLTVGSLSVAFVLALVLFSVHYHLLAGELEAREQAERSARESEESLRHLTSRLLQMQDEERRKFSRELHDSLGQYLAGVKMNLDMFARAKPPDEFLANAIQLLEQSISETRTISHLLHPPLLDEVGFSSAAKWYLQGFSERSGVDVEVNIPEDLGRLPRPLELGLFRVLQESLTNIHRHSKSDRADVVLQSSPDGVTLRVRDYGKGIPPEMLNAFRAKGTRFGVGLTGMRERVRELGGQLEIESTHSGTLLSVKFPFSKRNPQPSDELETASRRIDSD